MKETGLQRSLILTTLLLLLARLLSCRLIGDG